MNKLSSLSVKLLLGFILTGVVLSCDYQLQDVDLQENEEVREDLYHQILNDKALFSEFLRELMENPEALEQMTDNPVIRQYLYSYESLQKIMQNDPVLIDTIHSRMQRDPLLWQRIFGMERLEDTLSDHEMQEIIE